MIPLAGVVATAAGAPVRPDADAARELARQELAGQVYRSAEPGALERVLDAALGALDRIDPGAGGGAGRAVAVLVLLVALVVVVVLAVRATGRTGRVAGGPRGVLGGTAATAEDLRRRADAAAGRGDWAGAVTDRFRALVRALQERDLVQGTPGLTAAEAAAAAAAELPDHAGALERAAGLFDAVAYGGAGAGLADDAQLRDLDAALARARTAPAPSGQPPSGPPPSTPPLVAPGLEAPR